MLKNMEFSLAQCILVLSPPVLLITTFLIFRYTANTLGREKAYLYGFLFYWIVWCFLIPLLTVGLEGLQDMFSTPNPRFGKPMWLGIFLLVSPPLFMYLTRFPTGIKGATTIFIIYSIGYAVANGTFEEVLWRGTFIVAFKGHWFWAYLYPSFWFGLWHLSPQVVEAGTVNRETLGFAFISIMLGLVWGWVARTSGSIRWTIPAHILLNFAAPAGGWFLRIAR
jgi:membrane protease YdiL (CAAX protease family)